MIKNKLTEIQGELVIDALRESAAQKLTDVENLPQGFIKLMEKLKKEAQACSMLADEMATSAYIAYAVADGTEDDDEDMQVSNGAGKKKKAMGAR